MNKIVVFAVDRNYLNHVRYNIANVRDKHGDIDICVVFPEKEFIPIREGLKNYDVILKPFKPLNNKVFSRSYNLKYHVFETFFKNWENILYLDSDTMVYGKLDPLFEMLSGDKSLIVDYENYKTIDAYTMWCPVNDENIDTYIDLKTEINVEKFCFNVGIMLFNSSIIEDDTVAKLYELDKKYELINKHVSEGTDQPIINIIYNDLAVQVNDNYFGFWRKFNENSIVSHFCRWEAPWENNYFNPAINTTYFDYYLKSLNKNI
jgi:lipopolysaccharide biosynthesis glycosyltransferase